MLYSIVVGHIAGRYVRGQGNCGVNPQQQPLPYLVYKSVQSSRNACRFVTDKSLLGDMGRLWNKELDVLYPNLCFVMAGLQIVLTSTLTEGTFILSFCKNQKG